MSLLITGDTRRPPPRSYTVRVGIAVIGVIALVIAFAYLKPQPLMPGGQTVKALFTDSSGIGVVGDEVRIAGTPVGKITDRERQGDAALVTMELDRGVSEVHSDATAELRPHLAFEGTAYVDLRPGSPGAPALDQTIPLDKTSVYVPLDEVLRTFNPRSRQAIQQLSAYAASVLQGEGQIGLQQTLHGAPELTRTLALAAGAARGPSGNDLDGAVSGLSQTAAAVAARSSQLEPLLRDANTTLDAVETGSGKPLGDTLARLPGTLEALDSGGRSLDQIVARLDPLARQLHPGLAALPGTLHKLRPLVRRAGPALRDAQPGIGDLRTTLASGARATPASAELLAAVNPILSLLNDSLIPALKKDTTELHIPAYLAFLNLFEGGGGASRPFQTQANQIPGLTTGVGHFMRFGFNFFTGVGLPLPPCVLLATANPALAAALASVGGCKS
jgi:virulence factor Mce-like protein